MTEPDVNNHKLNVFTPLHSLKKLSSKSLAEDMIFMKLNTLMTKLQLRWSHCKNNIFTSSLKLFQGNTATMPAATINFS